MSYLRRILIFGLLTLLTQVGGIVYLAYLPLSRIVSRRVSVRWQRWAAKSVVLLVCIAVASLLIVPPLARAFGRMPLPLQATEAVPLQPANLGYVLFNRHYVTPELYDLITTVATKVGEQEPGTVLTYLDASFPFYDGYPLLPHRSHDDGEKVDLCFLYTDATGDRLNGSPNLLGYGQTDGPTGGEHNQPAACTAQGYWQYDAISRIMPQNDRFRLDEAATRHLIQLLLADWRTGKIFLEPHLKQRLRLQGAGRVRFHGCKAVRHDDHIHVQL